MLKKYFFTLLLMAGMLPIMAGELEDAFSKGKRVFLYLYTPTCSYCKKFAPQYDRLSKTYAGQYTFVKIDASTLYGMRLMRKYGGRYVPYVLLLTPNNNSGVQLAPSCLAQSECIERSIKEFK